MFGSRRHLVGSASALAISAVMTLLVVSSVVASGPAVVHRVSAGGPDACTGLGAKPGCDGNFSLVATQYADGTASGQYTDRFGRIGGIRGDRRLRGGRRQRGLDQRLDRVRAGRRGRPAGLPFTTYVQDNGTSATQAPDRISSSHTGDPTRCTEMFPWDNVFDAPQGQVVIH